MEYITAWEKKTAEYLSSELKKRGKEVTVKLWADVFSTNENPNKRTQLYLGHQRTEREKLGIDESDRLIYVLRYFIEIRIEFFTLKNHQESLSLLEMVLDDILANYKPYKQFNGFVPVNSGEASRNKNSNSWVYTGTGFTEIISSTGELIPTEEKSARITQVTLDQENIVIGGFSRE